MRILSKLLITVLLLISSLFAALASGEADGQKIPPTKLQVGIKYKPSTCDVKSEKMTRLTIHYHATLFETDKEFDSTLRTNKPFKFVLGVGQVVKGWEEGLMDMCVGEKRKLIVPPEYGYGERGLKGFVPGGATLVYEIELLKVEPLTPMKRKTDEL